MGFDREISRTGDRQDYRRDSGVTIIFGSPSKHSLHSLITVLMHNSGHFGHPLPFWAPAPPPGGGLPMASYATAPIPGVVSRDERTGKAELYCKRLDWSEAGVSDTLVDGSVLGLYTVDDE